MWVFVLARRNKSPVSTHFFHSPGLISQEFGLSEHPPTFEVTPGRTSLTTIIIVWYWFIRPLGFFIWPAHCSYDGLLFIFPQFLLRFRVSALASCVDVYTDTGKRFTIAIESKSSAYQPLSSTMALAIIATGNNNLMKGLLECTESEENVVLTVIIVTVINF
jgi:hypothetical protein